MQAEFSTVSHKGVSSQFATWLIFVWDEFLFDACRSQIRLDPEYIEPLDFPLIWFQAAPVTTELSQLLSGISNTSLDFVVSRKSENNWTVNYDSFNESNEVNCVCEHKIAPSHEQTFYPEVHFSRSLRVLHSMRYAPQDDT